MANGVVVALVINFNVLLHLDSSSGARTNGGRRSDDGGIQALSKSTLLKHGRLGILFR